MVVGKPHPRPIVSLCSLGRNQCFVLSFKANRSRELGATVYCVGVKDFNETQVIFNRLASGQGLL